MNKTTRAKTDSITKLLEEKKAEYKDTKEMEELVKFIDYARLEIWIRLQTDELEEDWLEAVGQDVRRLERYCKGKAGLLPPKEQEAFDSFRKFMLGPCDLPPYVK